ncbi:uncharacterized protein N7482_004400 [Penicillium canariense]|uniref:Uncharacterized protein n=1 Tax=Penicillium canariense TaxID=189055 RepID=A0A9W9LQ18_9EURO|nr:uncharacterized protein N7482_004400 [Penicillium canariense]KAJ5168806.1 hypothetical protein N7482_004400 [Penicillium canariense]
MPPGEATRTRYPGPWTMGEGLGLSAGLTGSLAQTWPRQNAPSAHDEPSQYDPMPGPISVCLLASHMKQTRSWPPLASALWPASAATGARGCEKDAHMDSAYDTCWFLQVPAFTAHPLPSVHRGSGNAPGTRYGLRTLQAIPRTPHANSLALLWFHCTEYTPRPWILAWNLTLANLPVFRINPPDPSSDA